jgi:biotin carboxyl carrier protein
MTPPTGARPQSAAGKQGSQTADRAGHGPAPRAAHPTRADTNKGAVASPAVGYFVGRDNVKVGATLGRGDVLGYVDVLGVRQEVVAPVDGTLRAIDVEPGQAVEYGQHLAKVEAENRPASHAILLW